MIGKTLNSVRGGLVEDICLKWDERGKGIEAVSWRWDEIGRAHV